MTGSSPLARGTPRITTALSSVGRLIPARAGNTLPGCCPVLPYTAHPRSRGEHNLKPLWMVTIGGSSPLARGTRRPDVPARKGTRLIPARAGNTHPCRHPTEARPAHPRSRGEHRRVSGLYGSPVGSSPLARGTPAQFAHPSASNRLIPARAGNTAASSPSVATSAAHPRSRGEHLMYSRISSLMVGSSPLARGTRGRC